MTEILRVSLTSLHYNRQPDVPCLSVRCILEQRLSMFAGAARGTGTATATLGRSRRKIKVTYMAWEVCSLSSSW